MLYLLAQLLLDLTGYGAELGQLAQDAWEPYDIPNHWHTGWRIIDATLFEKG